MRSRKDQLRALADALNGFEGLYLSHIEDRYFAVFHFGELRETKGKPDVFRADRQIYAECPWRITKGARFYNWGYGLEMSFVHEWQRRPYERLERTIERRMARRQLRFFGYELGPGGLLRIELGHGYRLEVVPVRPDCDFAWAVRVDSAEISLYCGLSTNTLSYW